jgi:hypothetical protein
VLGFRVTKASANDSPELLPLVEECRSKHETLAARALELCADKAYGWSQIKAKLYHDYGIKPVIDHRMLWKDEEGWPRVFFADRDTPLSC